MNIKHDKWIVTFNINGNSRFQIRDTFLFHKHSTSFSNFGERGESEQENVCVCDERQEKSFWVHGYNVVGKYTS